MNRHKSSVLIEEFIQTASVETGVARKGDFSSIYTWKRKICQNCDKILVSIPSIYLDFNFSDSEVRALQCRKRDFPMEKETAFIFEITIAINKRVNLINK